MLTCYLMTLFMPLKFLQALQECGNPNEPMYLPFEDTKEAKFVCPVKADEDRRKLEELSKQNYEMEYCLWEDMLTQHNENSCQYEVKPLFRKFKNKKHEPIPCSSDGNHFLHYFGYYYCGDEIVLEKFRKFNPPKNTSYEIEIRKSKIIVMYKVCFNMNDNTSAWTQHSIETPQLFQVPSNEQHYCETDIRKDRFFTDENFFPNWESRYMIDKRSTRADFLFHPQPLVPSDHFAVRLGKKATNHYINRKPLWNRLAPLMNAIDEGIKRAVIKASLKIPRNGKKEKILIFTKIETAVSWWTDLSVFKFPPLERNIWSKFVYDPVQSQSVIIYVHSNPERWVIERKCEKVISCNFTAWTRSEIKEYYLQNAYCCPITAEKANAMFPTKKFNIIGNFDIDSMATYD